MTPPLGFDIIVMSILEPFPNPWTLLSEAMDITYARITQAHGSPPNMETICRKLDWWGCDGLGIVLTWGAVEVEEGCVPFESAIAVIAERGAA